MWIYTATSHLYASFTEVILRGAVNWNNWTSFKTREGIMDCSIMRNMSWASSLTSRSSMMNAQSFILPLLPVRCVHTWDGFLLHTWWLTWWVSCGFESLARCQVPCMLLRLLCCAPHTHRHTPDSTEATTHVVLKIEFQVWVTEEAVRDGGWVNIRWAVGN